MKGNGKRSTSARPEAFCVWCKEPFDGGTDRRLHVSKLGAPGEFHAKCFEEYERGTPV
jgi:hypothetical protein